MPPPVALWFFVGFATLLYVFNALLMRALRNEHPELLASLGRPRFRELHSRSPDHWRMQFRFIWFVISGQGLNQTAGLSRVLTIVCGLSYVGTFGSLAALLVHIAARG